MKTRRMFFALWPTKVTTQAITLNTDRINKIISGKFVKSNNWHITLAFLGNIDNKTSACLVEQANLIQCSPFSMEFNYFGFFKKPKALYFGIEKNADIAKLNLLVHECKRIQDQCGIKSEMRQFVPHITVVRKASEPEHEIKIKTIQWQATEFVLVLSELTAAGSQYTVLNRWQLK